MHFAAKSCIVFRQIQPTHKNDDPKLWEGKKKLNEKRERGKELKINV